MKIHAGVLLSPATCAVISPGLQDFLVSLRINGVQAPADVRQDIADIVEVGREFRSAELRLRAGDVRQEVRQVANACSPLSDSLTMTYSTTEAVERLGGSPRALQRRVARGTLKATRDARGWLRFDKAYVDQLLAERTR